MPQFEIDRPGTPPVFVRARDAADAVRRQAGEGEPQLAAPEPGTGWQAVTRDGQAWGRVRARDRMRFRRD